MGKNKLKKFREVSNFKNVWELTDFKDDACCPYQGKWASDIFGNRHPVVLELACGKGEYTIELARQNPHINIIGIDIKGARLWRGAKTAQMERLNNVRFLRIYIDHITEYFAENEIDSIWITFPDPHTKRSNRVKRLTSPRFMNFYRNILKPKGRIHLKTDSTLLYQYTRKVIKAMDCPVIDETDDLYARTDISTLLRTKTYYENKHLKAGKKIKYLQFGPPESNVEHPKIVG